MWEPISRIQGSRDIRGAENPDNWRPGNDHTANIVGRVSNFSEPSKSLRSLIEVRNSFVP